MRVLIVVHGFAPHAQGGAEIHAEQHALGLVRLFGDEVHVLTREQRRDCPEYATRTERRDGLVITWINNTFRDVRTYEQSYRCPRIARIARDVMDDFQPDIAHVHHLTYLSTEIPGLLASRGVPVVFTLHDYWLMCHRGQLLDENYQVCAGPEPSGCRSCLGTAAVPVPPAAVPALRALQGSAPRAVTSAVHRAAKAVLGLRSAGQDDPLTRQRLEHMQDVCGHVTRFLAPSESIRTRFIGFGIAPARIELSPYGFLRDGSPPRPPLSDRPPLRIGFLGTLMASKAPHVLIEAFRQLPPANARVELVGAQSDYHGDGSYRAVLEPLLDIQGVHLHGPQHHDKALATLATFDVLVVPSIWPETSPLVIQEAFLAGVPVVASNIGGIPELVAHERNGLLFEAGDVDGLRHALLRLIEEPDLLPRLKAGAAGTAVRPLDDGVAATRQMYESLVAARKARGPRSRIAAVVLNFRTADDTALAVGSLMSSDRHPDDIIVVDNGAGDGGVAPARRHAGCRDALARWNGAVAYLPTDRNLGFPAGMNVGIRHALERGADFVLLVNSDVVIPPDCVGRLERSLMATQDVGIAGPLILSRSFPDVVESAGVDYSQATGRMRHRANGAVTRRPHEAASEDVDAVSGCVMLVSRTVFDRVGLFDERYFFSFEEIDLCLRAREAGLRTRIIGGAVAYHEGARTIGPQSPRRLYFAARNHLLMARTAGREDRALARGARSAWIAALNLGHAVKAGGGSVTARVGASLRGIRDHFRGSYGPDWTV